MKIHGYFKKDFEKWYLNIYLDFSKESEQTKKTMLLIFYKEKFTERYGVYVDFGDSVGIHISLTSYTNITMNGNQWYYYKIGNIVKSDDNIRFKTRHEAREQSIIKLQEIYNEQRKDT